MIRQTMFKGIQIESNEVDYMGRARWGGSAAKHEFFANTSRDLMRICATSLGSDLLGLIGKRYDGIGTSGSGADRTVTISYRPLENNSGASTASPAMGKRLSKDKQWGGRTIKFAGEGGRSIIRMHNEATSEQVFTQLAGVPTPTWIALAHELIHALHHLSGTTYSDKVVAAGGEVSREEMATTGLGVYANARISENAIRAEAGLALRTHYTFPNDHANIDTLEFNPGVGYWYCSCLQEQLG